MQKFDILLFLTALVLTALGVLLIFSATLGSNLEILWEKQLLFAIIAVLIFILVYRIPTQFHDALAYVYYLIAVSLLILVLFWGRNVHRWIELGFLRFQPSEVAKLSMVFVLARWFRDHSKNVSSWLVIAFGAFLVVPPFILVVVEPDLGTGIVMAVTYLGIMWAAGVEPIKFFAIVAPLLAVICASHLVLWGAFFFLTLFILWRSRASLPMATILLFIIVFIGASTPYIWSRLRPYQRERILVFLNPEHDPFGAGYQLVQSKIAIGSGGIWGKGFLKGTQTKYEFLPAKHSDFIFATLGEQFGFIMSIMVIALYWMIIWRGIKISLQCPTHFGKLVSAGIVSIIFFQVAENIGMTIGLAPITGIPLPFLSSGGTSLAVFWIMIAILERIKVYRGE